jgi:hypothetical protein
MHIQESRHMMNMTPNDPWTKASTCKSSGTQPENGEAWIARIQALTPKEMMSNAHMQVHTKKESREKQPGSKPGPNRAETGLGRPAWADRPSPFWARFDAPFDLAAIWTIIAPSLRATEKFVRHPPPRSKEGRDTVQETRGSRWLTRVPLDNLGTLHGRPGWGSRS